MNYSISKEKNLINFLQEGKAVPYYLDINTGKFYGLTNKPISRAPQGLKSWITNFDSENNLFMDFIKRAIMRGESIANFAGYSNYLKIIDKLNSIGYNNNDFYCDNFASILTNLKKIEKYFKSFCKYYTNHPEIDIKEFIKYYEEELFFKENNIDLNIYSPHIIQIIKDYKEDFSKTEIPFMIYYITHGLYEFYCCTPQTEKYTNYQENYKIREMIKKIQHYFKLCQEINISPQKGDFFKLFVNAQKTYTTNKLYKDNNKLTEIYNKNKHLFYENDEFSIVFPTTREMLFQEGEAQRNCVYNHYYQAILEERNYIVFIRKKDNLEKSYITCEINKNGKICQFLGKANNKVSDEKAISFYKDYQNYLDSIFKK